MSVLQRPALESSPLADLHAIAAELSIERYRRLRRAELIDAILARQSGGDASAAAEEVVADDEVAEHADEAAAAKPRARSRPAGKPKTAEMPEVAESADEEPEGTRRRRRRGGRSRGRDAEASAEPASGGTAEEPAAGELRAEREDAEPAGEGATGPTRSGQARGGARAAETDGEDRQPRAKTPHEGEDRQTRGEKRREGEQGRHGGEEELGGGTQEQREPDEEPLVEGVVELLPNGSGFLRVNPPDPSDEDVYISAAQVKRCELISGDRVAGPRRAPRRSERFASLVRIDTVNGLPAAELAHGARYEELAVQFPQARFRLGSEDPTVKAIEWLTPFGRGSRVTIVGAARSGKSEALRRLLEGLAVDEGLACLLVLVGVRPEEISLWQQGPVAPVATVSLGASPETQAHAVELAIEQAKRMAVRGSNVLVAIDTLEGVPQATARRALAAARNLTDAGSLTVIATAPEPLGGETTVISLDVTLTSTGRFPALDLVASGTIRAELLVGEAGAEAIERARAEALESP